MTQLYDIADYFPQPPLGKVWTKIIYQNDATNVHSLMQFRNAMDTEGIVGTRQDDYLPNANGSWKHESTWWYKPSPYGFIEFQDYVNGKMYTYPQGLEINWSSRGPISRYNASSRKIWGMSPSSQNWHVVTLNEVWDKFPTPFGERKDILVVSWVQTYFDGTTSKSDAAVYYMDKGRGIVRIDYPGHLPLYAVDAW